ncbi:MAG: nuclear transport factor 2 family protein [Gemmatimonadales bacterium]
MVDSGMDEISQDTSDRRAVARRLVDAFINAWSRADVAALVGGFSENAVFYETPFSDPMIGTDAIRRYWADVPYHQSEIKATSGEVYLAGPWFATEFKVVFRRRRTGEWVEARGALFCETEGEQISEMRMYWQRKG